MAYVIECNYEEPTFPSIVAPVLVDGYSLTLPKSKKYLGGRSATIDNAEATIEFALVGDWSARIFLNWYVNEIDNGLLPFNITLDVFGVQITCRAQFKSAISSSNILAGAKEISTTLVILDNLTEKGVLR